MTLRQLLWMAEEKRRAAGELVAWQSLVIPRLLFCEQPSSVDELNPYATDRQPADPARERLNELRSRLRLRALAHGGDVPHDRTPEEAEALRRMRARQQMVQSQNTEAQQAAIRRILERGQSCR